MTEDTSLDESNVLEKTGATEIQERRMSLLEKVKEGAELVKVCKKRLSEIENEFEIIQREVNQDGTVKSKSKKNESDESDPGRNNE